MPSSGMIASRPMPRQRQLFDPKTGHEIPYNPFPKSRFEKVYHIAKLRHPNPFLINKSHMAST